MGFLMRYPPHNLFLLQVLALLCLAGCTGLHLDRPLSPEKDDWAVFGGSNARRNVSEERVVPPLTVAWIHDLTGGIGNGSVLVVDSTVIIGNLRGELYAINANSGKRYGWIDLGEAIQGSPALDSAVVYVASANAEASLIAYDIMNGSVLWKKPYGDIEVSPLLTAGKLFFGTTSGTFYCVDAAEGKTVWKFDLPENTRKKGIRSTATIADSIIIFGAEDANVYGLNKRDGTVRWRTGTSAAVDASPSIDGSVAYIGDLGGKLYAINVFTGTVEWFTEVGGAVYACPTITPEKIVVGTTDGSLVALGPSDGQRLWSVNLEAVINSSAVLSGSILYVGTLKKMLFAVNVSDGSIVWSTTLPGRVKTSPAIADGKLFLATDDKSVLAFREGGR
jgi:outer membrane protein assembly factor BamB